MFPYNCKLFIELAQLHLTFGVPYSCRDNPKILLGIRKSQLRQTLSLAFWKLCHCLLLWSFKTP